MSPNKWTERELNVLRELYDNTSTAAVAKVLGRTSGQVYNKAYALGLKKSAAWLAIPGNGGRLQKGSQIGKATQFTKGQQPANKGKKLAPDVRAKVAATMFKAGKLPHNTLQDGAIRIRKDKRGVPYQFIRLSLGRWLHLHVHNYQQCYGTVPPGMIVCFKDRNTMNCHPENLALITRAENMRRNTIQRYPAEIQQAMKLVSKLKRKINEKQN